MPVTASSRPWRQNWGHLGSQAFPDHDMVYSMSMNSSMESSRDAFSMRNSEASQQVTDRPHTVVVWVVLDQGPLQQSYP